MIWLKVHIEAIERLLAVGTPESLTFAALRARLALEEVCYQRLRNAHDYISPDDLQRWQPRDVIRTLIQEVDPNVASNLTISICPVPVDEGADGIARADYEAMDFVEVGRQQGFDAARLGKVWNALGSFLHVSVPTSSNASVSTFGEADKILGKVRDALEILTPISDATLIAGGIGEVTKFQCNCGTWNKRRASLLRPDQVVNCLNPDCKESWETQVDGKNISFHRCSVQLKCAECGAETPLPRRLVTELGRDQRLEFECIGCSKKIQVLWRLMHGQLPPPVEVTLDCAPPQRRDFLTAQE